MKWNNAKESKPKQGERVLLKIKYEECVVVGYLGLSGFEACTENVDVEDCADNYYGGICKSNFKSEDVSHWCEISNIPEG